MLTKKQKQVLDFITSYCEKFEYSPSLEEMKNQFKFASVSTSHFHVKRLQEAGYLQKFDNKPRSIIITENEPMLVIPLLGSIAAGQPIEAVLEKESIAVPKRKIPDAAEVYALKVIGDSMIDENINDGDVILIKHQEVAENGQKVVALLNNRDVTMKKIYYEKK